MKTSSTLKMAAFTLTAFLLTSTLSFAQPGPRGGSHHPPRMDAPRSAPRMSTPPSRRPEFRAPAPSRSGFRAPSSSRPEFRAPSPSRGPSFSPNRGPSSFPSRGPSISPNRGPSVSPNRGPSSFPSRGPSVSPNRGPVTPPSVRPHSGPRPGMGPGPRPGSGPNHIPSGPRPSWQTRPHSHFDPIYSNVHRAMYGPHVPPPPPRPYWNNWGLAVSLGWNSFAISTGVFTFGWWDNMYYAAPWWNYYYYRRAYPVYYWWGCPTWNSICSFYPAYNWTNGFYYDYGQNVIFDNDSYVYINGQRVTTQYEYAQSAAELASYNMPSETVTQTNLQWLPLGTFALSTSAVKPQATTRAAIQLAATNDGLISGSFYNRDLNKTYPIQGRVDPKTQRVAFFVIGAENTVFETGMYNLTQPQTPILIHKNTETGTETKNALLVRLNPPTQNAATTTTVPYVQNTSPYVQSSVPTVPYVQEDKVALPIIDDNDAESVVHSILE